MQKAKITVVSDSISPRLKTLLSQAGDKSKKVLVSMGVALQSWIVQSFTDKAKRIEPWKPKADGTASTLQKSTKLRHSITMRSSSNVVEVGTDTKYAPYHQFGTKSGLPRRPFFPYTKQGQLSAGAEKHLYKVGESALKSALKK